MPERVNGLEGVSSIKASRLQKCERDQVVVLSAVVGLSAPLEITDRLEAGDLNEYYLPARDLRRLASAPGRNDDAVQAYVAAIVATGNARDCSQRSRQAPT